MVKNWIIFSILVCIIISVVATVMYFEDNQHNYQEGEIFIRFQESTSKEDALSIIESQNLTVILDYGLTTPPYQFKVAVPEGEEQKYVDIFSSFMEVEFASLNYYG